MKDKHLYKYFMLARSVGTIGNPCYSRQIGTVIVDSVSNSVKSTGYNGPAARTEHCDSEIYLRDCFWPQLTANEKMIAACKVSPAYLTVNETEDDLRDRFVKAAKDKGVCPRRYIDAGPGERSNLCSCAHSEANAVIKATCDLSGCIAICWCGMPCIQCTDALINANIREVYCLKQRPYYHPVSIILFRQAEIKVVELLESELVQEIKDFKSLVLTKESTGYDYATGSDS